MPRRKKLKLAKYEPFATDEVDRGVIIDVPVSLSVKRHEPMLFIGDLVFPISRANAWVILFGPDEDIEKGLSSGRSRTRPRRRARDLDKPTESVAISNRKKRVRRGLCGIKDCPKKHLKGSSWCAVHLKKMQATAAAARAKRKTKEAST